MNAPCCLAVSWAMLAATGCPKVGAEEAVDPVVHGSTRADASRPSGSMAPTCGPAPDVIEALFGPAMEECYAAQKDMDRDRVEGTHAERCRAWLAALRPLTVPDCITVPESADQKHVLRSLIASSALNELRGVEPDLPRAQRAAVDGLLAQARGNGGVFVVMAIGSWLKALDAGDVTPDIEAWRPTVEARFPSSRHRLEQELARTRRHLASTSVEDIERENADLKALMASDASPPPNLEFDKAMARASLEGGKAALKSMEQVSCVDWGPCLEELARLDAEQAETAKAARTRLNETLRDGRALALEDHDALVALASATVVEDFARAMRQQEEVLQQVRSRPGVGESAAQP